MPFFYTASLRIVHKSVTRKGNTTIMVIDTIEVTLTLQWSWKQSKNCKTCCKDPNNWGHSNQGPTIPRQSKQEENHTIERTASSYSQMYYERTYCTISHVVKNMAVECILHMRENALFWLRSLKMKIDTKYLPFGSWSLVVSEKGQFTPKFIWCRLYIIVIQIIPSFLWNF